MPYTNKSLAMMWIITLGLFVVIGSGAVAGWRVLLIVLVALAAPALLLTSPRPDGVTTPSRQLDGIVSDERDRSPQDVENVDASEWENEGGARLTHVSGGISAPAPAGSAA